MSRGKVLLLTWNGVQKCVQRIRDALSDLGIQLQQVKDPDKAWRALKDDDYYALMIMSPPGFEEGCLVTRMLRERCGAPIVVLDRHFEDQVQINYYTAGADLCMSLPFERLELLARLTGLWRRHQTILNDELRSSFPLARLDNAR
jgi:DNA-binding response OmpR family regulator